MYIVSTYEKIIITESLHNNSICDTNPSLTVEK